MVYINGKWRTSKKKLDVINPATGAIIESVSTCGKNETEKAVASATEAFKTWKKTPGPERGGYLAKAVNIMREKEEEFAKTITEENGKPLPDARAEVKSSIAYLEWYAEEARRIYGDTLTPSHENKHLMVLQEPVGVSAAITPWNFPLSMITRKIAPALAAGCTIVLKPASYTPLSAIKAFECFHEAGIPKGVVNLVVGSSSEIGGVMTSHKDLRKISFTGSTEVGKKLIEQSASTVKKVSMELGGHAPLIIFEDADIDKAIQGVLLSKFKSTGQTCISTNRVYVQESIADEFSKKLANIVSKLTVGNGLKEGIDVGPLIDKDSLEKVAGQVEDSINHNGTILCGGSVHTADNINGYFYEPTVIGGANDKMEIATEETFGPVVPIFSFKSEEEVIERANHKEYGLAAYCFTSNLGCGLRMMRELEYGIVGINDATPIVIQAPFGGVKESGMGKEGGKYGLDSYLNEKYVSIDMN